MDNIQTDLDVIIIGGSYAGLSAAMSLGRSTRRVLIIDGGLPCNRQTPHSHNFITHDGAKPAVIASEARQQVLAYPTVSFLHDFATSGICTGEDFAIFTRNGSKFTARRLILATGIKDLMPDIKGFAECWGISVVHCPYCHGYELRNRKTAIIANGEKAMHLVSLIHNLSKDVTILSNGDHLLTTEQSDKLKQRGIKIIEKVIGEIEHENGIVKQVTFKDGESIPFGAVYAALPFTQHSEIPLALGCELTPHGHIKVDHLQATSIKGVYACGDNSAMMRSLAHAVSTGNLAGAMANADLVKEEF